VELTEVRRESVDRIKLAQDMIQWLTLVKTVTFGFHKTHGIYKLVEKQSTSQKGLPRGHLLSGFLTKIL
jgi:hypothetical protein